MEDHRFTVDLFVVVRVKTDVRAPDGRDAVKRAMAKSRALLKAMIDRNAAKSACLSEHEVSETEYTGELDYAVVKDLECDCPRCSQPSMWSEGDDGKLYRLD
jgi:hypothetical protein